MKQMFRVAFDLLLEAARRKWFLALFGAITLVLVILGFSLQLEVVDGAIAGSKLFGSMLSKEIVSANRVMSGLFTVVAYLAFYGGAFFLALACSDFAPELLAPGRIEHLLSLPVARWQLLFGTFLGVVTLAALGSFYGAGGLTILLGVKTGIWNWNLLLGSAVGWVGFCALYSVMLTTNFFVRSAALSGALGVVTLILGVVASFRESISVAMSEGIGRTLFSWAMLPIPRLGTLATVAANLAGSLPNEPGMVGRLLGGCIIFSVALLSIAAWRFERKDF
ncbi:MAG: ABC transporter permease subunit [Archangium sp.]|nr:ABC transporter permease subunit [Archangium sp.]